MAVIKNNIAPMAESNKSKGRFMPKKNLTRVSLGKEILTVATGTSYTFSKGFFVPDDCRTDDLVGSLIHRIGGGITDYNTTDEDLPLTVSALMLYGTEFDGKELTENSVTGGRYKYNVMSARTAAGGADVEPYKHGVFAQMYDLAGTIFDGNINGVSDGMLYFECDRVSDPDNFLIKTVNPMAYMILEIIFTIGAIQETHKVDVCAFVDFQTMKD